MPFQATVFKVMIASPSDVQSERLIIREICNEWNIVNAISRNIILLPIGWETHSFPEMGDRPQSIINKQVLKDCDLLVGVFWTRIGTDTGDYVSGTVEEIEEHLKENKPAMLYFSSAPVIPDSIDPKQYSVLKSFKESCKSRGIYETYSDVNDFKEKFYRQLQLKINSERPFNTSTIINGPNLMETKIPKIPTLSNEAKELLKEASKDSRGKIIRLPVMGGMVIQTNHRQFLKDKSARTKAIWESAIEELEKNGLISTKDPKRNLFVLTRKGYDISEII